MTTPTARQIARAWHGVKTEYGVRHNKARRDGKLWEVFAADGGDPVVVQSFFVEGLAHKTARRFEDDARAKAILRLFHR